MKKYNVETVYALEGQIFKSYFEDATHATIFRGSIRETVEIESLVKDKVSVTYYYWTVNTKTDNLVTNGSFCIL